MARSKRQTDQLFQLKGTIKEQAAKIKELGMYTFVRWGFIFIAPPLIVTKEQINEGLAIISEAINIADESTAP